MNKIIAIIVFLVIGCSPDQNAQDVQNDKGMKKAVKEKVIKKTMTIEEIIKQGIITDDLTYAESDYEISCELDYFKSSTKIIFPGFPIGKVEEKYAVILEEVNTILNFGEEEIGWMKDRGWDHYIDNIESTDYGFEGYAAGVDIIELNKKAFQIFDKSEAFRKAILTEVYVFPDTKYLRFHFDCPWDNEHGMTIEMTKGKFSGIE